MATVEQNRFRWVFPEKYMAQSFDFLVTVLENLFPKGKKNTQHWEPSYALIWILKNVFYLS